jgi:acyl carrier protein
MNIASRTPEGEPNRCPICDHQVCVEQSRIFGDACCPHCNSLLWFCNFQGGNHLIEREHAQPLRESVITRLAAMLNVDREKIRANPPRWEELQADSLDTVEMLMQLEEEEVDFE